jgi:ketosteroid isomerase-like protein
MEVAIMSSSSDHERQAEHIFHAWDKALGNKDVDAATRLYTEDCTLESPLVPHLLGTNHGVVAGRDNLRSFLEQVFRHLPKLRQRYRDGFFSDGRKLMWEYPRVTPHGEQMDFVEIMELKDGLIHRPRVYWGWRGLRTWEEKPD